MNPPIKTLRLLALILLFCLPGLASAEMSGAADKGHGWLILPRGDRYEVYHHAPGESWRAWRRTDAILLTLPQRAACFSDRRERSEVILVFPPSETPGQRDVRRKGASFQEVSRRWQWEPTGRLRIAPALPGDSELRGLAADAAGNVYALLQGRSASVARPVDRKGTRDSEASEHLTEQRGRDAHRTAATASNGRDAGTAATSADNGQDDDPRPQAPRISSGEPDSARSQAPKRHPHVGPATRLLRLEIDDWVEQPLPDAVDKLDSLAWHLLATPTNIALLARGAEEPTASLFELSEANGWQQTTLPIPLERIFAAGMSDGGLTLALRLDTQNDSIGTGNGNADTNAGDLSLKLIRQGSALRIATIPEASEQALILFGGPDVVVISEGEELRPLIRVFEIATGRLREEGLFGEPPLLTQRSIQPLLIVFALLVAAVAMVVYKPEPGAVVVALGSENVPADVVGRILAFLVDLLPTMIVVGLLSGVTLTECFQALRSVVLFHATTDTLPLALTILALTLLHQALCEWLTGRTLGKKLIGLIVLDAMGAKVSARQAIVRNALKFVLLLFPVLLLLAVWSPWRQHLGDMAGRTVVAARRRVDDEEA